MKNAYLTIALTLICLLGSGIAAHAQDVDKIAADVPFDFVAGGKVLAAGTYTVSRFSPDVNQSLVIRNNNNNDSVFVLPMFFDGSSASASGGSAEHVQLTFEHVGNTYFLSEVETLGGVYAIKTPRPMTQVAQMKDNGAGSPSGSN